MPVPSTIADLSATASSNYPQGSESPSTLDDYIRAQGAIIRQVSDAKADVGGGNASGTWPVSISGNAATATTATTATNLAGIAQIGTSATATNNFTITAEAANGTVKLARGNAGATTQDILTVDASGNVNAPVGILKNGSVLQALSDFTGSNVSLASDGYQKLPSGLIIQWVRWSKPAGSSATVVVNLPITFPNAAIAVWSSANNNVFPLTQLASTTQITLGSNAYWTNTANAGAGVACAIGY